MSIENIVRINMDDIIFTLLYENALKTYKIEHLNCEFLKDFAKAMYAFGRTDGFYENIEEI